MLVGEGWHGGLAAGIRGRIRVFIEELLQEELIAALGRVSFEIADGTTSEWHREMPAGVSAPHEEIDALIAGSYLAATNTRRVGRALAALFRELGVEATP